MDLILTEASTFNPIQNPEIKNKLLPYFLYLVLFYINFYCYNFSLFEIWFIDTYVNHDVIKTQRWIFLGILSAFSVRL